MGDWGVTMSSINFQGLVSARQGESILFSDARNKFVAEGQKLFLSFLNLQGHQGINSAGTGGIYMPAYNWSMYLGAGNTATTEAMTALVTPIGTAPGTAPSTFSISFKDGASDGIWDIIYSATWNTGVITGTVEEMGLYLTKLGNYTYNYTINSQNTYIDGGRAMMSRLSTSDTEFTGFTIDNTKPLTVDWKIRFTFG